MGISVVLDVVIGLSFVYFLLALFCSWINEYIAVRVNRRGASLFDGLREMLQSGSVMARFVTHPLIESLDKVGNRTAPTRAQVDAAPDDKLRKSVFPSYVPASTVATVLLDLVAPPGTGTGTSRFAQVGAAVAALPDPKLKAALQTIVNRADNDLEAVRKGVEDWYTSTMDRVSGWYKKEAQKMLLIIGLTAALVLNVDTFQIARELWNNPAARNYAVEAAAQVVRSAKPKDDGSPSVDARMKAIEAEKDPGKREAMLKELVGKLNIRDQLREVFGTVENGAIPFGWRKAALPWKMVENGKLKHVGGWAAAWNLVVKLLGIFVTGCAVALGAPFWFELVNKLVDVRGSGKKPDGK
jgi:hypothetical protein